MFFRPMVNMRKTNLVNIRFFIFIAFASGVLTGCVNTEGTLKIKGKVLDESTKTGIPWKNIIVQGLVNSNNKSETIEVGQFSTDSSGCFTYSLRKIKGAYDYNFCFVGVSEYPVTINKMTLIGLERNAKYLSFSLIPGLFWQIACVQIYSLIKSMLLLHSRKVRMKGITVPVLMYSIEAVH